MIANNPRPALSVFSGVLLALAFPKFSLWWLAWVALVPFFYSLNQAKNWKEAGLFGFVFSVIFFCINLFWVTTLFRFVGWWAVAGWLGLALFQTIYICLFSILYFLISHGLSSRLNVLKSLGLALLWVLIEWLRVWGPFGVSAGVVGYSQVHFLPLIQIAALTQVYGVSFLVVFFNVTLAEFIRKPATKRRGFLVSILLVLFAVGYGYYELRQSREVYSQIYDNFPSLALIQPNIDQMDKMNPALVPQVFSIHENLTRQAAKEQPKIIIWPETAVFAYLLDDQNYWPRLKNLARETDAWLVIGTPYIENGRIYNSMASISPAGEIMSIYNKEHLVPFGEYLPFRKLLYPFLKGTGYYEQNFVGDPRPFPLVVGDDEVAPAICFESTFPDLIKQRVGEYTTFILTITNDAWFGDSSALYFHLDNGVFRAVENRKYFVQVGNSGFSAIIDPYGRVIRKSNLNRREVLIISERFLGN